MRAGLLTCDHVRFDYQAEFGDFPDMFARLFPEFDFKVYDVCHGRVPQYPDECDVYMTTGSRHSVYEDLDWIIELKKLITQLCKQNKYFIGFCFGHQLIGDALGGKVEKCPDGWCVGVHEFRISAREAWMQPFRASYGLLMMCQDQVVRLPSGARLLAGNELCPVGMFQMGDTVLGIQAHPEFSKGYDRLLMEERGRSIGEEVVRQGVDSLENDVHTTLVRDWVMAFIRFGLRRQL